MKTNHNADHKVSMHRSTEWTLLSPKVTYDFNIMMDEQTLYWLRELKYNFNEMIDEINHIQEKNLKASMTK